MGKTLQDQFLKMGLVDKAGFNRSKKDKHDDKTKGRAKGGQGDSEIAHMAKQALAEKKRRDQQLNKKKIAERQARADTARARQLIESHKIPVEPGKVAYNFKDDNTIKKLHLTDKTVDSLARGKIGIVKLAGEYHFVPADIIYRVRDLNRNMVILLNSRQERAKPQEDDPYAGYEVPDDLMW